MRLGSAEGSTSYQKTEHMAWIRMISEEELVSNTQIQASTLTTAHLFDLMAEKYHLRQIVLSGPAREELPLTVFGGALECVRQQ